MEHCFNCEYFTFEDGTGPYSDVTPGDAWRMMCSKKHFYMRGGGVSDKEFRETLAKGSECPDWERYKGFR